MPGNFFVSRLQLNKLQTATLSITFGIVLWALQGFLFGYLHVRFLTYLYILGFLGFWLKENWSQFKHVKLNFPSLTIKRTLFAGFIAIAVLTQLITTFAVGIPAAKGTYFCCGLPDSFFHIALTNELVSNFPPREPGIAGVMLHNYHFLPNLVNADLIRIYHIPLLYLQYPYSSILITILLALDLVVFAQLTVKKRSYAYWLIFFVFFSGDILFLLTFLNHLGFNFNTAFLENASWLWISPPRVYAATVFLGGLSFISLWLQNNKMKTLGFLVALTFGSLIGFKVYFGVYALVGLAALLPFYLKEKDGRRIKTILTTFFVSLCLYLPINSGAGGFVFTGLWRFNDFAANSVFGLQKMELARYIYLSHGNWEHALLNSLIYFVLYFIFIFGTLLIAFVQTKKSLSTFENKLNVFFIAGFVICFIFGSFFIQKTGGANSSQFLITDMIVMSVYAALASFYWLKIVKNNKLLVNIIIIVLVGFTVPRVLYETGIYLNNVSHERGVIIDNAQLEALTYLRTNTPQSAVILQNNANNCMYIAFLGQRQPYLCLDGAPGDRGVSTAEKLKTVAAVFKYGHLNSIPEAVNYLYLPTQQYILKKKVFEKNGFQTLFSNSEVTILHVQ